tara:strand:- start:308 stop:658 length:351 start_codon:yes stop_codon:yes gene_type:complete
MPYIQRDESNNIVAAQRKRSQDFTEFVNDDDVGLAAFRSRKATVVSYADFEARFTDAEAEALLAHIKTAPALERAVNRAIARNSVNLESVNTRAFMSALVSADVLTQARSDAILEP